MSLAGEEIIFNSGYAGWKAQKDRQEHIDKLNRDIQIAKQKGYGYGIYSSNDCEQECFPWKINLTQGTI